MIQIQIVARVNRSLIDVPMFISNDFINTLMDLDWVDAIKAMIQKIDTKAMTRTCIPDNSERLKRKMDDGPDNLQARKRIELEDQVTSKLIQSLD